MVSPLVILGAVGAAAVALPKKKAANGNGIPDNAKTRAYAEAVRVVEAVKAGKAQSGRVFNGYASHGKMEQAQRFPILSRKELPAPPQGWVWSQHDARIAKKMPDLPKVGATKAQVPPAPRAMFWSLEYEGNSMLPGEIMAARAEAPHYPPPPQHIPAAGYDELIEKMQEGTFYTPPPGGPDRVQGIEF